ncbi:hypothetical protein FACS1894168_0280 [Deltaproteobacteria bacterium]|nr:hypothetical protein FACS1894168_0280 [Deltaproteobacteria bacterium]
MTAYTQYIVHYGLKKNQINILEQCLPENTELHDSENYMTDIVAVCPSLAAVINPSVMPKNELDELLSFLYKYNIWTTYTVIIFTDKIANKRLPNTIFIDDSHFTIENIHNIFSNAYSRKNKNESYYSRIAMCINVLKLIRNKQGISTKEISEKLEVSNRTILRCIETLRCTHEVIDFDRQLHGWCLPRPYDSLLLLQPNEIPRIDN